METLIFISKVVGAVIAIWGALLGIGKFVSRPVRNFFAKIDKIYHEVCPNGGGSMRDAIAKIERSVKKVESFQLARMSHEETSLFDCDESGKIVWANRAFLREMNASEEQVNGYGYRSQIAPSDRARICEEIDLATAEQRDLKTFFRTVDGNCVEIRLLVVRANREVVGYTGTLARKEDAFCQR